MSVVSKDVDLLETLRRCLALRVAISECQSDGDRSVSLASASRPFIDWVQASVQRLTSLNGVIEAQHWKGRRVIRLLRYAKRESLDLLHWMYYAPDVPSLARKRAKAEPFMFGMR